MVTLNGFLPVLKDRIFRKGKSYTKRRIGFVFTSDTEGGNWVLTWILSLHSPHRTNGSDPGFCGTLYPKTVDPYVVGTLVFRRPDLRTSYSPVYFLLASRGRSSVVVPGSVYSLYLNLEGWVGSMVDLRQCTHWGPLSWSWRVSRVSVLFII